MAILTSSCFQFALKAENELLVFVSYVKLFQMHTPLYAKLFCPEDVLNRRISRSVFELRSSLFRVSDSL